MRGVMYFLKMQTFVFCLWREKKWMSEVLVLKVTVLNVGGKCLTITLLNTRHRSLKIIQEMIHNLALNHMAHSLLRHSSHLCSRSSNRKRHGDSHHRQSKCLLLNVSKQISFCDYQTPCSATYGCDNGISKLEMQLRKSWLEEGKLRHRILIRKLRNSATQT
jgi:hypothetical protein